MAAATAFCWEVVKFDAGAAEELAGDGDEDDCAGAATVLVTVFVGPGTVTVLVAPGTVLVWPSTVLTTVCVVVFVLFDPAEAAPKPIPRTKAISPITQPRRYHGGRAVRGCAPGGGAELVKAVVGAELRQQLVAYCRMAWSWPWFPENRASESQAEWPGLTSMRLPQLWTGLRSWDGGFVQRQMHLDAQPAFGEQQCPGSSQSS